MRYRQMDDSGDMQLGRFLVDSPETVAQAVITRLKLWKEEWFLDVTEGTPWLQLVLGHNTKGTALHAIRQRILDTQGVTSVDNLDFTLDDDQRSLTVSAEVSTDYGEATIYGVI